MQSPPQRPVAIFHLQQFVEKLLKVVLGDADALPG